MTAKPNGVHVRKRGAAPRTPQAAVVGQKAEQKLADFAKLETPAIDAQMWPVHAVAWLQPDLSAAAPPASGLRVERRHGVPVPDFLPPAIAASSQFRAIEQCCEPLLPEMARGIPRCDLAPLGWDPRTEARK